MSDRLSRFAPLTGLVFVALAVVSLLIEKESPGNTATGAKVIAFYEANHSNVRSSNFLFVLAFLFFLFFAASLRGFLRRTPAAEALSALVLAAAAVLTVGVTLFAGIEFALAADPSHLEPAAAQALNVLGNELFFPLALGASVFGIAAGLAILRGAQLPNWLGWVILVLGIAEITPAGEIGFFGFIIWTVVVSVLIYLRSGAAKPTPSADAPGALAA
jgi:hypothetical protein